MKIAVSSMSKDLNSMLDVRFGRCNYFVIYDTEEGLVKTIENRDKCQEAGQELQQPSKSLMKMWMSLSLEIWDPMPLTCLKIRILKSTDVEALRLKRLYNCSKKGS